MKFAKFISTAPRMDRGNAIFAWLCASILAVCCLVIFTAIASAADPQLSKLPTPVQDTIRKAAGDAAITQITKVVEQGQAYYDVEAIKSGKELSFSVTEAGTFSEDISLAEAPELVQEVIREQLGSGTLEALVKSIDNGNTFYDVDFALNGKKKSFSVDADGTLHEQITLDELPNPIRKIVQAELSSASLEGIEKSTDHGEIFYDIDLNRGGKTTSFSIASDGTVRTSVDLSETPEAVQKVIRQQVGNGTLSEIIKSSDPDGISYDVEFSRNGKASSFGVSSDGALYEVIATQKPAPERSNMSLVEAVATAVVIGLLLFFTKRTKRSS